MRHVRYVRRLLVALSLLAGTCSAQPYASAHLGYANANMALGAPYNGVVDDRSLLFGVDVGFNLLRRWGVEFGIDTYRGFDGRATPCAVGAVCSPIQQSISDNDIRISRLAVVPKINIGPTRVFAKVGYYHARIDTPIDLPDSVFKKNGLLLGAGVRWYFRKPWSVSVEATRFDANLYQFDVGVGWGFRAFE